MNEEKKKIVAKEDAEFEKSVKELTEAIVEDLQADYQNDLEPFEAYAQNVRAQVYSNLNEFRHRFVKGYEVLLNEIADQHAKEEKSEDDIPPPGSIKM